MFTGIIEATAEILSKSPSGFVIARPAEFTDLKLGSSVAISGVCLTVTSLQEGTMAFDVIPETWAKTKLGNLAVGDRVNLERAMLANGRFDGHVVQGHIEGVGNVQAISGAGDRDFRLTILAERDLLPFIVPKGSVTIDGVALTVAAVDGDMFTLALIPETLQRTTLGDLKAGDAVNLETDVLMRGLKRMMEMTKA